jgi:2-dehydropantoate 2-reductase
LGRDDPASPLRRAVIGVVKPGKSKARAEAPPARPAATFAGPREAAAPPGVGAGRPDPGAGTGALCLRAVPAVPAAPGERGRRPGSPGPALGYKLARAPGAPRPRDRHAPLPFARLFEGADAQIECADDFTTVAWAKLCFNVPAAVAALTGSAMGVLRRPDAAALARGLVDEAVRVGRAEGARLDDALAASIVDAIARGRPDARPSIVQDALARRPLEYDARNGAVVRAGARHGVATPLNAAITTLLAALSDGFERG